MKKWLGVTKTITVTGLYRNKDHVGMNMERLSNLYKSLQVTKGRMLKNSDDEKVKAAFEHRKQHYAGSKQANNGHIQRS